MSPGPLNFGHAKTL
jgi:hypothetical protein